MSIRRLTKAATVMVSAAVLATLVSPATTAAPATAATALPPPVSSLMFGQHFRNAWPTTAGSVRLWDTGVTWREVQPAKGVWDWSRLDAQVAQALAKRAQPVLVLGQTPAWASSRPTQVAYVGKGAAAYPKLLSDWGTYVKTVAKRYKGRVKVYETWNEPNLPGFFSGTAAQMKTLHITAAKLIKSVDPAATVLSPGMPIRRPGSLEWMRAFFASMTAVEKARYVDVVNLHLYPNPGVSPEAAMAILPTAKRYLALAKVPATKPIWNTEMNYGLGIGGPGSKPRLVASSVAPGYVARTMVLSAANRIGRVYWYAWDSRGLFGLDMLKADSTPTAAGIAWTQTYKWLVGARVLGCTKDKLGTYTCTVSYGRSKGKVMWNPGRSLGMRAPVYTTGMAFLNGVSIKAKAGARVPVGPNPVLVRTSR
jgi:hypothetical protein